jgi:hypothetical protein
MLVLFQWTWTYFTFGRGARLIYGTFHPKKRANCSKVGSPLIRSYLLHVASEPKQNTSIWFAQTG